MVKSSGADFEKTKIFLLAGFLGSGKTTLLNRILSWETDFSDTVVLVNEFGKIGIDGSIIKSKSHGRDVIELSSGCICCTMKDELYNSLIEIIEKFNPKQILLEATGVAEPESIKDIIETDFLRERMTIEKTITVLSVRYWIGREVYGPFFMNQVEQADLILLNKIDTITRVQLEKAVADLRETLPQTTILPTLYCEVDPEVIWQRSTKMRLRNFYTSRQPSFSLESNKNIALNAKQDQIGFETFDFVSEAPIDKSLFEDYLNSLPWEIFRIKGPVRFQDRTLLLNYVAGQIDWQEWDTSDPTRLAFIGIAIDAEQMIKKIKECIVEEPATAKPANEE